jgi:DNA-binding GntR family transcriptional regulator
MATGAELDQIERSTLATLVADQIRSGVLRGVFEPGSQLSEIALAERFGVSRGPVREALQGLVQDGLLKREPHRGVFVPVITDEDVGDIYQAREAIEAASVKHIIEAGMGAQIRLGLDSIVSEMEAASAAGDWDRVAEHDLRFHSEVVRAARSPRLNRMYATLLDETRLCLMMSVATPGRRDLVDEHRQIAALLGSDDPQPAIAAIEVHMREAVDALHRERARARESADETPRDER